LAAGPEIFFAEHVQVRNFSAPLLISARRAPNSPVPGRPEFSTPRSQEENSTKNRYRYPASRALL
jgi:hypothetical protein